MSEENENYEFSGFLENNETFEVPDKKEKGSKPFGGPMNGPFGEITPEDLKNLLGGIYPINGNNINMGNQTPGMGEALGEMLNSFLDFLEHGDEQGYGEEDQQEELINDSPSVYVDGDPVFWELGKIDPYLEASSFGSVECLRNENIYKEFEKKSKKKSVEEIFNGKKGSNIINQNDIVNKLPFEQIDSLELTEFINDYSVLLYAKPKDEKKVGFFVILYQDTNKELKFLVPIYGNTFKYNKVDSSVRLFDQSESRRLFKDDIPGGHVAFQYMILPTLRFFANYTLAPKKSDKDKYIITAKEVANFKNIMPAITKDSDILKIATITFNGSDKAQMVKDFAGVKSDGPYSFYLRFKGGVEKQDLLTLAQLLFKVDFNTCKLLENKQIFNGYDENGQMSFYIEADNLDLL